MSKTASNNKMSAVPYDTVKFRVPNGSKEKLIQYAKEHGATPYRVFNIASTEL